MKRILWIAGFAGFLLYRPYVMQSSGLLYGGDDQNYLAHATAIAYGTFPDYSLEANITFPPFHPWGCSVLAAPFVAVGELLDRLTGSPIIQKRHDPALIHSWTLFGFVLATQFYLYLGILFLFLTLRTFVSQAISEHVLTLSILGSGISLFAYRRPVFSHVYEFTAIAGMLYALTTRHFWGIVVGALGLYSIRYNDAVLSIGFILAGLMSERPRIRPQRLVLNAALAFLLFAAVIGGTRYVTRHCLRDRKEAITTEKKPAQDLYQVAGSDLLHREPLSFYVQRLIHIVVGIDWGLLYTAPLMLVSLWGIPALYRRLRWALIPFAALVVNGYICVVWGSQGSWYGYRYLLYAWLPFSTLMLGLAWSESAWSTRLKVSLSVFLTFFPVASMLLFEGNNSTLTLSAGHTLWSSGWVNNTYQWEVWRTCGHPRELLPALFKGGPLYVSYLLALLCRQTHRLPALVRDRYPVFDGIVFIKTLCLWFFPALFYRFTRSFFRETAL